MAPLRAPSPWHIVFGSALLFVTPCFFRLGHASHDRAPHPPLRAAECGRPPTSPAKVPVTVQFSALSESTLVSFGPDLAWMCRPAHPTHGRGGRPFFHLHDGGAPSPGARWRGVARGPAWWPPPHPSLAQARRAEVPPYWSPSWATALPGAPPPPCARSLSSPPLSPALLPHSLHRPHVGGAVRAPHPVPGRPLLQPPPPPHPLAHPPRSGSVAVVVAPWRR